MTEINVDQVNATKTSVFTSRMGRLRYFSYNLLIMLFGAVGLASVNWVSGEGIPDDFLVTCIGLFATMLVSLSTIAYFGITGIIGVIVSQENGSVLTSAGILSGMIGLFIIQIILTIRRCHDFDSTGFLSVMLFIPLGSIFLMFNPGTNGSNSFGPPPR